MRPDLELRERAATARREALQTRDTDGHTVSRSLAPIDVGVTRALTFPTKLSVELVNRDRTRRAPSPVAAAHTHKCTVHRDDSDVDCDDCAEQCDECNPDNNSGGSVSSATGGWGQWSRAFGDSDDDTRVHLTGVASVTETPYEMWDAFGPYQERISSLAFAESLSRSPDVAFLANHEGLSMARTAAATLKLSLPLTMEAWLNPIRQDVRDLVTAIRDGDITQMSFGAMLEEGRWNEEYTEFEMMRLDLNCGDVSAVNFGANPYTSIAARAARGHGVVTVLDDVNRLPEDTARAVLRALETRFQIPDRSTPAPEPVKEGRSLALVRSALLAEED